MTTLYIVRHGETEENILGILQGAQIHGKLTQKGILQAKKLSDRLQDISFDIIYSSDLARASDTAKIICENHMQTPVVFSKQLREIDFGDYTGKFKSDVDYSVFISNISHKLKKIN